MPRPLVLLIAWLLSPLSPSGEPVLKPGARVAVVGDSITEQKLYSRFIEDYLLACMSHLDVRVIQLGWGGERAPGFADRMENDLFPFRPDVVTTCYGMNDGQYRAYEPSIGAAYEKSMRDIVGRLKARGATVAVGSPGAVDTHTFRNRTTPAIYNENLSKLRDIARAIAADEGMPFANVHDAMRDAMSKAKPALGETYDVCGPDGFHPQANGHLVMAMAFIRALGLDGQIALLTADLGGEASASAGHKVLSWKDGKLEVESRRYPFCFSGDGKSPASTRSILPFIPFNAELNRFTLVVKGLKTPKARVAWGDSAQSFTREALETGINLAAEFPGNPFSEPFRKVDELVGKKQSFETAMIKEVITRFRTAKNLLGDDAEAKAAIEKLTARLLAKNEAMHREARDAVAPVRHTIAITQEG